MKIVIAPDSFKGSLSSQEVIAHIRRSAEKHFPDAQIEEIPISDGGDGMVEAVVFATGGTILSAQATDPLGRMRTCIYGSANGRAVIGMSETSGAALLREDERDPMEASSAGTGDAIRQALNDGFTEIFLGIGGSATNDGGTGCMQSLGMKFLREDGSAIDRMCGRELINIAAVDDSELDPRLKNTIITIMCDVTNPLTGSSGATYVYGSQKGGTSEQLDALETGMISFARILDTYAGRAVSEAPGAGAAGGIGAALTAFLGAKMVSGINAMLDLVHFGRCIFDADLIVTGEGRVDGQSAFGKVIHGVASYAKKADVPVIVIAGSIGEGAEAVYPIGVSAIVPLPDAPMTLGKCIENADELIQKAADRAFALISLGKNLGRRVPPYVRTL